MSTTGKKIVIPGADFSANGILAPHVQLDWIMSKQKGQYINTNIAVTQKMKIEICISSTSAIVSSSENKFIAICGNSVNTSCACGLSYNPAGAVYTSTSQAIYKLASGSKITDTNKHVLTIDQTKFTKDGVTIATLTEGTITQSSNSSKNYVLGIGSPSYLESYFHTHYIKIYSDRDDSSSIIFDAIPVKKANGTVCLYDKISQEYFCTIDNINPEYAELTA